jgi:LmbE family N-acetylglucosaminyl deacetylase
MKPLSSKSKQKTTRVFLIGLGIALLLTASAAQPTTALKQSPEDRISLYQALLDLTNPWTVMCIAAHPDDEDGTSLIVMRRKYGAHTVSLFSTFGEGGQNAIGPELYEELGAIRARETMAAAQIQGSEPHFLGLKDFGYSKSADEAFRFWGHEEALRRMVLEIRRLRPDVIITNHSVTNNDHGHHQATARLELEAFDAAADPKRFQEQLKDGVTPWQVQRLFVRARGNAVQSPDRQGVGEQVVTIDPNERDPIRNTVFAEEALRALQKHATQGPWPKTFAEYATRFRAFSGQPGGTPGQLPMIRYALVREAKGAQALPTDSHNFLDGLNLPENIAKELNPPMIDSQPLTKFIDQRSKLFDALDSERHDDFLLNGDRSAFQRYDRFSASWDRALALIAGLTLSVETSSKIVTPDSAVDVTFRISTSGPKPAGVFGCAASIPSLQEPIDNTKLESANLSIHSDPINPGFKRSQRIQIPAKAPINLPLSRHLYDSSASGLEVDGGCSVIVSKRLFQLKMPTHVDVASPVQIDNVSSTPAVRTRPDQKTKLQGTMDCMLRDFDYKVRLTNNQEAPFAGQLIVGPGFGRRAAYHAVTIAAHDKVDLTVSVPGCPQPSDPKAASEKGDPISLTVVGSGAKPLSGLDVPIVFADARVTPNLRVGYVRGFDYSLPNALAALGVESKELSVDDVKTADLQKYTSIIVDNRVYESTPGLIAANQKLLDYANAGGTLIVFYHKSFEWNPDERRQRPQLAPYKLILGDERITDENAPITFLEPQHPLLNVPNKLGSEDFINWIQERGLYYPKEWDPQFHALLQSNDPGEAPLKGGLLVADYGRGRYIYTSMVWYRELRAGVPGAYRMLANMISYGHAK